MRRAYAQQTALQKFLHNEGSREPTHWMNATLAAGVPSGPVRAASRERAASASRPVITPAILLYPRRGLHEGSKVSWPVATTTPSKERSNG